ncbi:hypothetical protein SRABI05_00082 [Agrobacterium fabrum]|uniref:hypothetical protein n=1 Tax=Agrobacterium fabrum TaxID=1176649 RepID=UPI001D546AB6|nr:hypothetical protein [Agrobacterium fabrum]CAH0132510.1 hypothetical protein SRABI05_00082 [Agrobacterium fabrum]CAH0151968.1 hypothetical protein SRABI46_00797 [Agrobacterium fabrum]
MSTNLDGYGIESCDYLSRAKDRIAESTKASLFYAALELRCYVECRQAEYLDAQRAFVKSVPPAWKIGNQWRTLQKVMKGHQIQHIRMIYSQIFSLDGYYVPVSDALKNGAERMSELIHAQLKAYGDGDAWWDKKREEIIALYRLAWVCQQGNMLAPSLISHHDGKMIGRLSMTVQADKDMMNIVRDTKYATAHVRYYDTPPSIWVADI